MNSFDPFIAFNRNLGLLTAWELGTLLNKRVAIGGLGGVGGSHLLSLIRLGVGKFHLADMDRFELKNFNRQEGANMHTLEQEKAEALKEQALAINPQAEITLFKEGIQSGNLDLFFKDVDLYIDGIDFFCNDIRFLALEAAYERGIPAMTVGPIGMGTAYQISLPGKMSFKDFYGIDQCKEADIPIKFLVGVSPRFWSKNYLQDPSFIHFGRHLLSSAGLSCRLSSAVSAAEACKILLKRGKVYPLPYYHQFDAYLGKWVRGYIPFGHKNPIQKLRFYFAKKIIHEKDQYNENSSEEPKTLLQRILCYARFAPSGDNSQPWHCEEISQDKLRVTIEAPSKEERNALDNRAIFQMIHTGIFLESFQIAAMQEGFSVTSRYISGQRAKSYIFELHLKKDESLSKDPLFYRLLSRHTNRDPFLSIALSDKEKRRMEESVGDLLKIEWHEGFKEKVKQSFLYYKASVVRLLSKTHFLLIKNIIDFDTKFSTKKIPLYSLGFDCITRRISKWAMQSWERMLFLNKWLLGARFVSLKMGLRAGLCCGAWFTIYAKKSILELSDEELIEVGRKIQRFWLTADDLGLVLQPDLAPSMLCQMFSEDKELKGLASLEKAMKKAYGADVLKIIFRGRMGVPRSRKVKSRSIRKKIKDILD